MIQSLMAINGSEINIFFVQTKDKHIASWLTPLPPIATMNEPHEDITHNSSDPKKNKKYMRPIMDPMAPFPSNIFIYSTHFP